MQRASWFGALTMHAPRRNSSAVAPFTSMAMSAANALLKCRSLPGSDAVRCMGQGRNLASRARLCLVPPLEASSPWHQPVVGSGA